MEHRISFDFQARYEVLGEPSSAIENIWFVCHGHGQLSKFFIRKFETINDGKTLIVAPEGLFKYYLEGFTGRVGATWMTKEDRVNDIENYLKYLSAVLDEVISKLKGDIKVTLFGFSQGAATISRFATQTDVSFDRLVLWAGIFPPDLPPLESQRRLSEKECFLVYGLHDQYLTEERIEEQACIAKQINVRPKIMTFSGGHELNEDLIKQITQQPQLEADYYMSNIIYVCTVSGFNVAELEACLFHKPKHIVLIVSDNASIENKAKLLQTTLERELTDSYFYRLDSETTDKKLHGNDIENAIEWINAALIPKIYEIRDTQSTNIPLYLNSTGGTKAMLMALISCIQYDKID